MTVATPARRHAAVRAGRAGGRRGLALALFALAAGLALNSLLGPLVAGVIDYPLSATLLHQTAGLEAFTLVAVAPFCWVAGILALRGHPAAPLLAFGPAAYASYMFMQYIVGPEYDHHPRVLPLHLALFVLGAGTAVAAWASADPSRLPPMGKRSARRYAVLLLLLAGFIVARYLPALAGTLSGEPLTAEFRADVSMYWSILWLDLGLVVPGTVAAALALARGRRWGHPALYLVFGWFALVPPSVAAMSIAMLAGGDPNASTAQAAALTVVATLFAALAIRLYRPLFRPGGSQP